MRRVIIGQKTGGARVAPWSREDPAKLEGDGAAQSSWTLDFENKRTPTPARADLARSPAHFVSNKPQYILVLIF